MPKKLSKWLFIAFLFISRPYRALHMWFRDAVIGGHWYLLNGQRRTVRLCWQTLKFFDDGLVHAPQQLEWLQKRLDEIQRRLEKKS